MKTIFMIMAGIAMSLQLAGQTVQTESLSLASAKKLCEQAEKEAKELNLNVSITILDRSGRLLSFHRMDGASLASIDLSIQKANTAAMWQLPSKVLEDLVHQGQTRFLTLSRDQALIEGGIPIEIDGKTVGAIGVSGAPTSEQDALIAKNSLDKL